MTREKEIRKEATEVTHFAQFGHSGRDMFGGESVVVFGIGKWDEEIWPPKV